MVHDGLIVAGSYWAALLLRFDGEIPAIYAGNMMVLLGPIVGLMLVAGTAIGVYRSFSRYASVMDLVRLGTAVAITCVMVLAVAVLPAEHLVPLSVPLIASPILLTAVGSIRLTGRLAAQFRSRRWPADSERVLIVGAGDAGEIVARDMLRDPESKLRPVGFLDDASSKQGQRIHGIPVLGRFDKLEDVVRRTRPDHVLIAMPGVPTRTVRPILHRVVATGVNAKILPSLREVIGRGGTATADIRDVDIADLIGREPVRIHDRQVAACIQGRIVLVTGAAGSIGTELARQALKFRPARLILLDNNETDLFYLWKELEPQSGEMSSIEMVVGDIRDRRRVDQILSTCHPHLVFHAAAYKHVPVMELQAAEAVKTNIMGTSFLAEAAAKHGTERFVLVSTDKAVRPSSVMGATKRVAEMVMLQAARGSSTVFAAVRFGNVLGSRGSVVPIFARQISEGGPITVTHPDASRYFMTIEEAASLILEAAALAAGGDTFMLDMQEPVRITDLAERMRDLLARDRDDIDIVYTGLRPGEKLHEELWHPSERLEPTGHPRILRVVVMDQPKGSFNGNGCLRGLEELAIWNANPDEIRRYLFSITCSESDAISIPDSGMLDLAASSTPLETA